MTVSYRDDKADERLSLNESLFISISGLVTMKHELIVIQ